MAQKDFYETLGVERNASDADLKKAYRRMAMKFHPDRNAGMNDEERKQAEEHFKEVKQAYEVLSDPKKRAAYDQFGHAGVDPSAGGGPGGGFGGGGFGDIFEDLFGDIFGGGRAGGGGSRPQHGADLRYNLELTLEQAVKGATIQIEVPKLASCVSCQGSGAAAGSKPVACETCEGVGQVRIQQGFFSIQQTCPHCHGSGKMIKDPCTSCRGQGRVQERRTLSVKVPAGVDDGDRIRLSGEGEAGMHGAPSGDLYVHINVKAHDIFERDGNNLACEVPINFVSAALGGEIEVPTLEGRVKLKIPNETQTGKVFRLRGKGVKSVRGHGVGDLFCRVVVETPVNLSKEQKKQLEQFQATIDENPQKHNPRATSWFSGVKRFFESLKF